MLIALGYCVCVGGGEGRGGGPDNTCKRNGVTGKLKGCDRNRAKQRESIDQQKFDPYDVSESACFSHAVDSGNASFYCSAPA